MAPPILYNLDASNCCRTVLLTAKAIGLQLNIKNIDLFKHEQKTPEFLKMNPQHTLPTLNDNGFIVWDSHAISSYLVGKYAKDDSLYPKDLQKRATVDQRLHFDSGILFARIRAICFPILFLGVKEIPKDKFDGMHEAYGFADAFVKNSKYFAGDQLTIADFSAIGCFSTIDPIIPIEKEKYPNLVRWMNTMKKLPYYEEINGKAAEEIAKKINEMKNV